MHHVFDIDLAKKYGVLPAILLEYISHWVVYNHSLNQNRVDGKFWTYNSLPAMREQFPYMTVEQIKYAVQKLKDKGLVDVKRLSTDKMNKTNWYTLTEKGIEECRVLLQDDGQNHDEGIFHDASGNVPPSMRENSPIDEGNFHDDKDLIHYSIENNNIENIPPLPPTEKETVSSLVENYTADTKIKELLKEFIDLRMRRKKPLTPRAMKMALNKLTELSGTDADLKQKIIEQTIFHCWDTFYAIHDDNWSRDKRHQTLEEQMIENEARQRQKGIIF